jgi:hypothetical protein
MAAGYLAFARQASPEQRQEALDALLRAARISTDELEQKQIESLKLTLEGEALLAQGIADQVLFQRAREVDPSNERARDAIQLAEHEQLAKQTRFNRFAAAGVIGVVAILAILAIALRRGRREAVPKTTGRPGGETSNGKPADGERSDGLQQAEGAGETIASTATAGAADPSAQAPDSNAAADVDSVPSNDADAPEAPTSAVNADSKPQGDDGSG